MTVLNTLECWRVVRLIGGWFACVASSTGWADGSRGTTRTARWGESEAGAGWISNPRLLPRIHPARPHLCNQSHSVKAGRGRTVRIPATLIHTPVVVDQLNEIIRCSSTTLYSVCKGTTNLHNNNRF